MKSKFIFLVFLVIVGCKSDYEKALQFLQEKDYENATLYLNTIDSTEENYTNARIKLEGIEKTIDSISFNYAIQAFKQKDYNKAQLLFTGFGNRSVHYREAQKYLAIIQTVLPEETLPNINLSQEDDKELKLAKENVIRLYKELLRFKDNPDFYNYGFAVNYKYNSWMKEIEEIRKNEKIVDKLYDEGYPIIDLQQIGLVYRANAGKETEFTQYVKNKYSGIQRVSR